VGGQKEYAEGKISQINANFVKIICVDSRSSAATITILTPPKNEYKFPTGVVSGPKF
jgi:hypothetical protein